MKNNSMLLIGGVIAVIVIGGLFFAGKNKTGTPGSEQNTQIPTVTKNQVVPLPSEQDIIRSFFNIINEQRPSDAAKMMNTTDDSTLQAWAVQFNAFKSIKVKSIEPSMQEEWSSDEHTYKVTLDVVMKPEAANSGPIPNYGYDNGENIRWVVLKKVGDLWKIQGLATGP